MSIRQLFEYKPEPVKIEGYWFLRSESGYIKFGGKKSAYLLVPDKTRKLLMKVGIDLQKRPKPWSIECEVITEGGLPKLVFSFKPQVKPEALNAVAQNVDKLKQEVTVQK